ncbi:MAG TPA: DUF3341 domain-containing protein [Dyella sp.]|uniref:DUF3341 domain-containing protein n=1 Tax=Dyella sp. TaxID=1869338 RepID=UPI002D107E59|nr:DUF3341 domain-containing protein [Dyella sp.]HUB88199.1 DUF3341 domain-containing protein [Dyella sp.]
MAKQAQRYGCMAFFETPESLVDAVRALRQAGYASIEAYTPFPVEALDEALGLAHTGVPLATFVGGAIGFVGMLVMQYIAAVLDYPERVGGRPFASWPAFIPAALEMTFLLAAAGGVLAMLVGNRLPKFYHAVFNVERFERVSQDQFALVVRLEEGNTARLRELLQGLHALQVDEVPA